MRPHPAPKIRDEGLRGASKMMDDNLWVFGKIIEIVRPLLHHAATLGEILRVIVGGSNAIANLFPERANVRPGYHVKDRLEDKLHQLVCAGTMSLPAARAGIARDWTALYRRVSGAPAR